MDPLSSPHESRRVIFHHELPPHSLLGDIPRLLGPDGSSSSGRESSDPRCWQNPYPDRHAPGSPIRTPPIPPNSDDVMSLDCEDIKSRSEQKASKELSLPELPCQDQSMCKPAMTSKENPPIDIGSTSSIGMTIGNRPLHEASAVKPKLTLSAYRRPEETVRVADFDRSRRLDDIYDLDGRGCGILGHGAMSTVRLATRRSDGTKVAVKSISKYDILRSRRLRQSKNRRYLDEWEILKLLQDNPNIVSLLDVFETDEEVQLVMEYCTGGELYDAIQKYHDLKSSPSMREEQAARVASQMLCALDDLHSRGIVHRDVKPENILLSDARVTSVKLCDFGLARLLVDESDTDSSCSEGETSPLTPGRRRAYSTVGSDLYAAPEVSSNEGYGTAVDVYSLGVTLYAFLSGSPPSLYDFDGSEDFVVDFPNSLWLGISEVAKDLLRKMLNPDPESRITAQDALKHPWTCHRACSGMAPQRFCIRHMRKFSPSKPRPAVDLDLVRSRLCLSLDENESEGRKRSKKPRSGSRKRRRLSQGCGGNFLMAAAMEDLYRGVADAAASATAAAAGVLCDEMQKAVRVVDDDDIIPSLSDASLDCI